MGQGVELVGRHAARHDEVPGAFGRGIDEHGRLYLEEAFAVEELAYCNARLVAQLDVLPYGVAAQVEVTVFHPQVVAAVGVVLNCKGRHERFVEHVERGNDNLDFAGGDVFVFGVPFVDGAGGLDDVFAPEVVGLVEKRFVFSLVEHQLRYAVAIAQVDERQGAHFADSLYPAGQRDGFAHVGKA